MTRSEATLDYARPGVYVAPGLFRNRAFLLLWGAYGISAMGDHISELAILKWMDAMHAENMTQLQALMNFMFMLPFFCLGPFNGILADRLPRRGIMITADLIRVVLMLCFSYLLALCAPIGQVGAFVPLMIVGIFAALFSPARCALLPTLIREDQLVRANGVISGLGVIATMMAMVLGGWLVDRFDEPELAFRVDAGTFVLSAVLLYLLRPPAREKARPRSGAGPSALAEGVRYVCQHRRVGQLILVAAVVWGGGAVVRSTMPALVRDVYDRQNYTDIGIFQAYLGLGMLTGALILSALGDALRSEIAITWSLAGIAVAVGTLAGTTVLPVSPGVAHHIGVVAVVASGLFGTGVIASYHALLQRIVPNRLRGRVFGLTDLVSMAGLLLATGLIGIPRWANIDRWIGWILAGVALVIFATAATSLVVRLRGGMFRSSVGFWWNVNEFYCKWWFRLRREGICTVPAEGPVIVVANHTCTIDPLLLIASTPNRLLAFMIAEEYSHIPVVSRLIRMVGCVPVRRESQDTAGTRAALRHLKAGNALGIFIEGGIVPPGETREPKDGAAMLALHSGALVVPAYISGTRYDEGIIWSFFRRHRARVRFGQPIDFSRKWIPRADKEALHRISRQLMDRIKELGEEA